MLGVPGWNSGCDDVPKCIVNGTGHTEGGWERRDSPPECGALPGPPKSTDELCVSTVLWCINLFLTWVQLSKPKLVQLYAGLNK